MNLYDALAQFDKKNRAGQVPDRRSPGKTHTLSAGRRDVVVSHVRNAVARAAGVDRGDERALAAVDVQPLFPTLAELAYVDAEEAGRAAPRNERANVALFVATVEGKEYEHTDRHGFAQRRPIEREAVLPEWRPLFDALVEDAVEEDGTKNSRKSFPAQLVALQNLVLKAARVRTPYDIRDNFDAFMKLATAAGVKRKKAHAMLAAIRRAREILGDERIPSLYQGAAVGERALHTLPTIEERLRARGCKCDPRRMTQRKLVKVIAPKMERELERRLKQGKKVNRRPGWFEDMVGMTSRIAASLARLGIDPAEKSFVDLWSETKEVNASSEGEVDPVLAEVMGKDYVHTETISLMRQVADECAHLSYMNSSIRVVTQGDLAGEVPIYTQRVVLDVKNAWLLVREVFGPAMQKHKRAMWVAAEGEYRALLKHMEDLNETRHAVGHRDKSKVLILWPQAVCMFLPWLMNRVEVKRAQIERFLGGLGREGSRTHRKYLREFDVALREYVFAALILDDGLRVKNYAGALAGRHIVPTVEKDKSGRWVRFTKVESRFRGIDDDPLVLLKMPKKAGKVERKRERHILPAFVNYDLLFEYWTEVRPRELVRRGVIESVEAFDPEVDSWALFVSPRRGGRKTTKGDGSSYLKAHAAFGSDYLSQRFAKVFHEFIGEQLSREIPAWDDPARTQGEWEGLFSGHITRTLIATWFGGICGDWETAAWLTNDAEATLREHYSAVADRVHELAHAEGWENPRWFDVVLARAEMRKAGDDWSAFWREFDPADPAAGLDLLVGSEAAAGRQPRKLRVA